MTPLQFMALFPEFRAPSWDGWRSVLAKLTPAVKEFYAICGRGSGKSRIVALLACCFAARHYQRAAGESIYLAVFAPDRRQAGVTHRYICGLMKSVPSLAALIERQTRDSLVLSNGVNIEVISSSIASPRGRSYALAIVEEAAFLPQDQSANPDVELLRALRPALARVPSSLLAVVSSPYARRGILWQAWQRHQSQPAPDVLLVQAPTLELNPTFDRRAIDRAYEEDPASAASEYGAQFRADIETFVAREVIEAAVVPGRRELPPLPRRQYAGFLDFAGGSGTDSATCAVAHEEYRDGQTVAVLDAVREVRPPFRPEQVCAEFARLLTAYGIVLATADRYAGEFPVEAMSRHGVTVIASDRSKSEIYREFLPHVNSGAVELLDLPRLTAQLASLERRTARGGRDSIDHAPGGHDDVANAACGALVELLLPVSRAGGVGRAVTSDRPVIVTTVEEAERELAYQRRQRLALPGDGTPALDYWNPRAAQAARDDRAAGERYSSSQVVLDQLTAEQPIGRVRRTWRPVKDPGPDTLTDWDPFNVVAEGS